MKDTITIKDLEAYRGMAAELESLEAMRMWTYFPVSSPNGHENIGQRGNSVSNPTEQAVLRLEEIDERISQKREELSVLLERILNWVDSIEDPTIRAMIQWHYRLFRQAEGCGALRSLFLTAQNMVFGALKKIIYVKKL